MAEPRRATTPFQPGDTVENPALKIRSLILESTPELLRTENEVDEGGNGGPIHRHLRTEERFVVAEGTLRVRRGLRGGQLVGPGEEAAVAPGIVHTFVVERGPARFVTEFRPAHRIADFFQELFALATDGRLDKRGNPRPSDLAVLMQRYPEDFFYAPIVPPALQRALAKPLARLAARR